MPKHVYFVSRVLNRLGNSKVCISLDRFLKFPYSLGQLCNWGLNVSSSCVRYGNVWRLPSWRKVALRDMRFNGYPTVVQDVFYQACCTSLRRWGWANAAVDMPIALLLHSMRQSLFSWLLSIVRYPYKTSSARMCWELLEYMLSWLKVLHSKHTDLSHVMNEQDVICPAHERASNLRARKRMASRNSS